MDWFASEVIIKIFLSLWVLLVPLGIIQVTKSIRNKFWKLHTLLGYLYTFLSFVISSIWLIVAILEHNTMQLFIYSSMRLTALIWLGCLVQAVRFTVKKRFFAHGIWMRRNFILSIAGLIQVVLVSSIENYISVIAFMPTLILFCGFEMYKYMKNSSKK